jgi:hypothetical protein
MGLSSRGVVSPLGRAPAVATNKEHHMHKLSYETNELQQRDYSDGQLAFL